MHQTISVCTTWPETSGSGRSMRTIRTAIGATARKASPGILGCKSSQRLQAVPRSSHQHLGHFVVVHTCVVIPTVADIASVRAVRERHCREHRTLVFAPRRAERIGARFPARANYFASTLSMTCTQPLEARTDAMTRALPINTSPSLREITSGPPDTMPSSCPSSSMSRSSADVVT